MDSRRDFLKKAALLAAGGGLMGALPASIQKAFAIDPTPGSTYLDAEHIVILMQENRSFDHAYGTLRGVRGFNDPRAMTLPDGNPVWLQSNAKGETYAPFRFNIKDTKVTWMGSLPHSRQSQVAARNGGKHDRWLDAKASDNQDYAHLPLTMGHYTREDIPFYYALADAFTICDQNFCSALTCTTPNRLYLWTGTVRAKPSIESPAKLSNDEADLDTPVNWATFPERLEAQDISWRVYQNEICLSTGLTDEEDAWLSNFGDNPLEYFTQYHVRFSETYRRYLVQTEKSLAAELQQIQAQASHSEILKKQIAVKRANLEKIRRDLAAWSEADFARLPSHNQNLNRKAFVTNQGDRNHRRLETVTYHDGESEHQMKIPKGDVLHQFREDVRAGKLPTVSWIVPPERFSDHPSSPWYGAWYLSETFDILTQNPEVWKKTIFILCYDENDGYFDHVPPFMAPHPNHPGTGKTSARINTAIEQVSPEQEKSYLHRYDGAATADSIGLGFRVPLVIASPWSRGGYVCSQVFDHTSVLQFLEKFLSHKTGQPVRETNISDWRRTVCGDLTSVFRPYHGEKITLPTPLEREKFLDSINRAQFRPVPDDFKKLSAEEITQARKQPRSVPWLPRQESGVRPACALPYELAADGILSSDRKSFMIRFAADNKLFGEQAAGAPFRVYAPGKMRAVNGTFEIGRNWNYAVSAGDRISDNWPLDDFENGIYHLQLHGPNGFYREFRGSAQDPLLEVTLQPVHNTTTPDAILHLVNHDSKPLMVVMDDLAYGGGQRTVNLNPSSVTDVEWKLNSSFGWHDWRIRVQDAPDFEQRCAGHIEIGCDSFSDPIMG
ncbi:MAG TPA: phospholipase C, phosphocholine-specific [Verrucomicrobiae bacterium]|nr:phospholipase C, phosphocholine-specific [Verrucomicrobiae bacterium]